MLSASEVGIFKMGHEDGDSFRWTGGHGRRRSQEKVEREGVDAGDGANDKRVTILSSAIDSWDIMFCKVGV
jgi:hypothetical protein